MQQNKSKYKLRFVPVYGQFFQVDKPHIKIYLYGVNNGNFVNNTPYPDFVGGVGCNEFETFFATGQMQIQDITLGCVDFDRNLFCEPRKYNLTNGSIDEELNGAYQPVPTNPDTTKNYVVVIELND